MLPLQKIPFVRSIESDSVMDSPSLGDGLLDFDKSDIALLSVLSISTLNGTDFNSLIRSMILSLLSHDSFEHRNPQNSDSAAILVLSAWLLMHFPLNHVFF